MEKLLDMINTTISDLITIKGMCSDYRMKDRGAYIDSAKRNLTTILNELGKTNYIYHIDNIEQFRRGELRLYQHSWSSNGSSSRDTMSREGAIDAVIELLKQLKAEVVEKENIVNEANKVNRERESLKLSRSAIVIAIVSLLVAILIAIIK